MTNTSQPVNSETAGIKILIADDHRLILEGFGRILQKLHGVAKVDTFTEGLAACRALQTCYYDVYIVDLKLPDISGFDLMDHIRSIYPEARILICTMNEDVWIIKKLMQSNVNGIVLKSSSLENIEQALQKITAGEKYFCPRFTLLKERYERHSHSRSLHLTMRELEVLGYIVQGMNTHEIALQMGISDSGVEGFRRNMFGKTGVSNVAQLVVYAYENNLVGKT